MSNTKGTRASGSRAIGYARVSTDRQAESGLGLEAQRQAIQEVCDRDRLELVDLVHDVASGKSTNGRHALKAAMDRIEAGDADTLVVMRLDRLARSVIDGAEIIRRAQRNDWGLVITDLQLDTRAPMGQFGAHILLAAAELERAMISERTKAAKAEARRLGKPMGGRPAGSTRIPEDVSARIVEDRKGGKSFRAIARELTADGVPTANGAASWSAEAIRQVVLRAISAEGA
ncbi:MAG: recombinase family protein [Thermoleophilia bacterium]